MNAGSLFYATLNAIAYFYMVCSWGGYTFIINLIPMHAPLCIVIGCYYIAYAPFVYIIIHVVALAYYIKGILSPKMFKVAVTLVVYVGLFIVSIGSITIQHGGGFVLLVHLLVFVITMCR